MSLPTYRSYARDEELGQIPAHWKVVPLKRCFSIFGGSTPKSDETTYWDGDIVWVSPADLSKLSSRYITDSDRKITEVGMNSCGTTLVPANSIVLSTRAPIGSLAIASTELCTNQGCKSLVPRANVDSSFYAYVLMASTEALNVRGKGTTFLELSADELASYRIPHPPLGEQTAIAAFLDCETSKIDALIAEQVKLLELLAEKRQATISHTVTRGLNPNVPLKDSGVEWLGAVPAHWEVVGLTKYLDSIVDYRGRTPTKVDNGAFLVTAKNIRSGAIDYEASQEYIDVAEYDEVMRRGHPLKGDVLFTTEAPLGQVAIVDREDIALAQRIIKFRPAPRHLDSGYLKVWIMGSACQFNLQLLATGSTALGIKGSKVGQVRLCLPPLEQQQEIVRHINIELSKLNALDAESKRAIELLKERRSALISAAVTGKIDVREHSSALAAAA
ncbi:restriction endonuclease subunit S [Paraburkholderia phenoliruptrix]|uniref:restriction endonuclease subunit S n=1 Tax=Paraburkholderia phenoliruptrix TaxID=252970 RepID=UPI001C4E8FE3|nr:restriction endonuclease subunit S [Paraburkholderia phenoliruptrix]MBW0447952.1 restriction endonuclease subunit S [Paraburkholderia phenoliruptrix]MBW9097997.1 restriction endonuclease subunit S [Paraburkholderia phenoliruptrix]